jgi:spore photoproduct lyase
MNEVETNKILWISMGCFRYAPGFKEILREINPQEILTVQEMFPGPDGKYRYLKSKRIEIYTAIKDCIESYTKGPFIYLCMETADMWRAVFNRPYQSSEDIQHDMMSRLAALLA